MIKFFQKLKAKKGFTLVELIVVIAIIGVLAAILIPTMLGYVTSSRVQSANSTAAEIKNMVNNFITDMDTKGYTFDRANDHQVIIKVANGTVDATVTGFNTGSFKSEEAAVNTAFRNKITADFNFDKAYALVIIENGKVVGCAYSPDGQTLADTTYTKAAFKSPKTFASWNGTDGVDADGYIIGTAPQLTKALAS